MSQLSGRASSFEDIYENSDILRQEQSVLPSLPRRSASSVHRQSSTSSSISSGSIATVRQSYDDVTISENFNKPVISSANESDDIFESMSFTSPIQSMNRPSSVASDQSDRIRPVPAPRPSKLRQQQQDVHDERIYEDVDELKSPRSAPIVPPRNSILKPDVVIKENRQGLLGSDRHNYENVYSEVMSEAPEAPENIMDRHIEEDEDEVLLRLGARPKQTALGVKTNTIDIRNTVEGWFEGAVQELERDASLDLNFLEQHSGRRVRSRSAGDYEHIAPGMFRNPRPTKTLLRNFDPIIAEETEEISTESSSRSSSRQSEEPVQTGPPPKPPRLQVKLQENDDIDKIKEDIKEKKHEDPKVEENFYVLDPLKPDDPPPPTSPPPPLPKSVPPPLPPNRPRLQYENVWLDPITGLPALAKQPSLSSSDSMDSSATPSAVTPPPIPARKRLPSMESTTSSKGVDNPGLEALSDSSSAHSRSSSQLDEGDPAKRKPLLDKNSRSKSTTNIISNLTNFTSSVKRKISDMAPQPPSDPDYANRTFLLPRRVSLVKSGTRNHSGALFVLSKSRKAFQSKWCVLGNNNFRYFNEKDSLAIPKELISLPNILSLTKHKSTQVGPEHKSLYCFDVAYFSSKGKYSSKTFGAQTASERELWLEKMTQSLSSKLQNYSMVQCSRLGWAKMKEGFAGEWRDTWISLMNRALCYTTGIDDHKEFMDLKKTKDLTLRKDIKHLNAPRSSGDSMVLVVDFVDRSLYLLVNSERECEMWKSAIEATAFNNGNTLVDQQMTGDDVPVIVDKCLKFVFSHGCMSEGIYRQCGVNTKINRLLDEFRNNAWAVQIVRENYSEHDVANTLKRFMRTLEEPLLTEHLRGQWMKASTIENGQEKLNRYRELLNSLPTINYNTLRRLMHHLRAIADQCNQNRMHNSNLAAIWGPTLLTVDGQEASDFAQTPGETDVCRDLIDNYPWLFNVDQEEINLENKIIDRLRDIHFPQFPSQHSNNKVYNQSGDLRIWVYIDTKTSGQCIGLVVPPTMTAGEMTRQVITKADRKDDKLVLHEVILGGNMERPIHHSEMMLDVTLKWGKWDEEFRRDNYLLLKRHIIYEEALPCALPPLSVFGEAKFAENKPKSKFKKFLFSMSSAKITCYQEKSSGIPAEKKSWPIEEINWYLGFEDTAKRSKPPHPFTITFIPRDKPVQRSSENPYFGNTIAFESRELFIKWVAAMMVAEHGTDIRPPDQLVRIEER